MRVTSSSLPITSLALSVAVAALIPAFSCGDSGDTSAASGASNSTGSSTGAGGGGQFDSVIVEPKEAALTVELGGSAKQAYQAFGVSGDKKVDISASCDWSVSPSFGAMDGPSLTAAPHGGTTDVTASCDGQTAKSALTVMLKGVQIDGADTPMNAPALFDAAQVDGDPANKPAVLYPIDGAVAPLNIPPIDVQWGAPQGDLFHVSLLGAHVAINVYTKDVSALLPENDWAAVAGTAAGDELRVQVEGLVISNPATKFASDAVRLNMSHDTIDKTAIYYWASSQGSIITQNFGTTTAPTAIKADCTSCHSVSRSGSRIGYSRCVGGDCGQLFAGFMRYDPATNTWLDTVDANQKAIAGSYTTFAPIGNPFKSDKQAVALLTLAGGSLQLIDPDTGMVVPSNVADVASHGPGQPRAALMADWSSDGSSVVFASTPHPGQWIDLSDSAIASMSYAFDGTQHAFGEPSLIVSAPITLPSGVYNNFFFPSFSSDNKLVVFNAARSAWRDGGNAAAPGQRLMLTDAKGSWVTDLTAMNGEGDLNITWPRWAPGNTNDYLWVVFSSERAYGHKITAANSAPACKANGVKSCKQIWIGAVSRAKLAGGMPMDPSAPPVWVPGQDIGADNISPYWTVPVSEIPQ